MKDGAPQTIYLADYTPPSHLIESVHLTFRLAPDATRVISKIAFRSNPEATDKTFSLHGEALKLLWAKIDGQPVKPTLTSGGLTCDVPSDEFTWEAEVEIDPKGNTALEGLYMSNGMYCTQCEAEGFRKITYYPDRPDVMAVFTVRIEGDLPVLLSNGNPGAAGQGFAEWHDPWPKPAYLFALVAGDLVAHSDRFTTMSGKDVDLNIFVRPGDEGKCAFGMIALKQSMTWDEQTYGREYDLDVFNIVAVDDFNMGAMENKGLNIFNSSCVLASPETSTDSNFERIEAIIAHEYFHNWTGNRITCRDWFQLCLKEGLTVFRDQQFTSDMRGAAVKRIDDAVLLRSVQFREDGGPLAHPVRPDSFVEINNFYTVTVYEKGAELIGMLKRIVGDEGYVKALDLYFDRHDGDAATIEDWLAVFEDATGRDMSQFKRWYAQAGTPRVTVKDDFAEGRYRLTFAQMTPPTPGQDTKEPVVIPIEVGLLAPSGKEVVPTTLCELTKAEQTFTFEGLTEMPIPSILRDFSAPVVLEMERDNATRAFLLAHDTDPFNRWDAGRALAADVLCRMVTDDATPDPAYLDGLAATLRDDTLDPAFRALVLSRPSETDIGQMLYERGVTPDPLAIHRASQSLKLQIAEALQDMTSRLYSDMLLTDRYQPNARQSGMRRLGNSVLSLITMLDGGALAAKQYAQADNMTQRLAALNALLLISKGSQEVAGFYDEWKHDRLVMDKWFGAQVAMASPETAVSVAKSLSAHPDFDMKNPNRFRAVFGALAGNTAGFHSEDGQGYEFFADWLIKLDAINPQITARMCSAFQTWSRYDSKRQGQMREQMERILAQSFLSKDTTEMLTRQLS